MTDAEITATLEREGPIRAPLEAFEFDLDRLDIFDLMVRPSETVPVENSVKPRKRYRRPVPIATSDIISTSEVSACENIDESDQTRVAKRVALSIKTIEEGCLCRGVDIRLTTRTGRRTATDANLTTEIDCIRVVHQLLETAKDGTLDHMSFRPSRNLGSYLGLSISDFQWRRLPGYLSGSTRKSWRSEKDQRQPTDIRPRVWQ